MDFRQGTKVHRTDWPVGAFLFVQWTNDRYVAGFREDRQLRSYDHREGEWALGKKQAPVRRQWLVTTEERRIAKNGETFFFDGDPEPHASKEYDSPISAWRDPNQPPRHVAVRVEPYEPAAIDLSDVLEYRLPLKGERYLNQFTGGLVEATIDFRNKRQWVLKERATA